MSWNYRIICSEDGSFFDIHEVYYDGLGKPHAWSENSIGAYGETLEELRADFKMLEGAFAKPVLRMVREGDELFLREDAVSQF